MTQIGEIGLTDDYLLGNFGQSQLIPLQQIFQQQVAKA